MFKRKIWFSILKLTFQITRKKIEKFKYRPVISQLKSLYWQYIIYYLLLIYMYEEHYEYKFIIIYS